VNLLLWPWSWKRLSKRCERWQTINSITDLKFRQVLLDDLKISSPTVTRQTSIQHRQTSLLNRIQKFDALRRKYMPGLASYLANMSPLSEEPSTSMPERIPLYLPSTLPAEQRSLICVAGILEIEDQLRFAQAHEALTKLRCQLMKRTYASRYKARNGFSQRHYTRFRTLQDHVESKIKAASQQYRAARLALLNLRGPGIWEQTLQELQPSDVRGLSEKALIDEEAEEERKTRKMAGSRKDPIAGGGPHLSVGDGYRTLSWIWYSTAADEFNNTLFTEARECFSHMRDEFMN